MTDKEQAFIRYLQDHPELYEMMQARPYMLVIEALESGAKTEKSLMLSFSGIEQEDLKLILKSLEAVKVAESTEASGRTFYYLSDFGKDFLARYRATKDSFLGSK